MHELSIVLEIVKTVEAFARENGVSKINTLVLQIGELSTAIPQYIEDCYPMAVEGTLLENAELEIEILPGTAFCLVCEKTFNLKENDNSCPDCHGDNYRIEGGREFMIKEIVTA